MRVLSVTSEVYPLVKTGGLADVAAALPAALVPEGIATRTLVPGYPGVLAALRQAEIVHTFADLCGGPARLLAAQAAELDLLVVDAPHLYARSAKPDGPPWPSIARSAGPETAADKTERGTSRSSAV